MRAARYIAAASLLLLFAASANCGAAYTPVDSVYYWFACCQTAEGPVIAEDWDSFSVEDEALAAMVFLARGHYHRADRILTYFEQLRAKNPDNFRGFFSSYQLNGEPLSSEIRASSQFWLINAAAWYTTYTGDKSHLRFARDLAKTLTALEGPEGGIAAGYVAADPIAYITANDNILACSVFSNLWTASQSSEYRFAAYRSYQFLNIFLLDPDTGNFASSNADKRALNSDIVSAALVFEHPGASWKAAFDRKDFVERAKASLLYSEAGEKDTAAEMLNGIESSLRASALYPGGAALPPSETGGDMDIRSSAWFLLASAGINPLKKYPTDWKDTDHYFKTFAKYAGDDFEEGEMKMLLVWSISAEQGFANKPRLDWFNDKEKEANGGGVMRIFLPEKEGATPAKLTLSRQFLEPQDFSSIRSIKYFIKAVPGAGPGNPDPSLKIAVAAVDGDGETWVSKDNAFVTRVKYTFNIGFPAEWSRLPGSKGNGVFDVDKIKGLMFLITQESGNSWDIYIDDISIQ